jgi:hypothetical protein
VGHLYFYSGTSNAHEADRERVLKEAHAQPKLGYCGWMKRYKKPSNKEKMFCFINAWLLSNMRLPKLV